MKAAVVEEWGRAPSYTDHPEPTAAGAGVIATVEASALTNLTKGLMSGKHYASSQIQLPAIPGVDSVARLEDGTRVYTGAVQPYGMMAERTAVDPGGAVIVPDDVDSVTAAAIPNLGVSAWMSLQHAAAVQPGDHVLVLGATGVTGATAVQLASSAFGAGRVVVAGRDTTRLDWLRTVGADEAIVLGEEDLRAQVARLHGERPFDAVLDYLWGEPAKQTLEGLGSNELAARYHHTRFVQIGTMAGLTMDLPAGILRSAGITISGVGLGSVPPEVLGHIRADALPKMFAMVAAGELHLTVEAKPLSDVERLWTAREPSGTRVVLTP